MQKYCDNFDFDTFGTDTFESFESFDTFETKKSSKKVRFAPEHENKIYIVPSSYQAEAEAEAVINILKLYFNGSNITVPLKYADKIWIAYQMYTNFTFYLRFDIRTCANFIYEALENCDSLDFYNDFACFYAKTCDTPKEYAFHLILKNSREYEHLKKHNVWTQLFW